MLHPFRVRILSGFTFLSRRFSPGYDVAALQAAHVAPQRGATSKPRATPWDTAGYERNRTLKGMALT